MSIIPTRLAEIRRMADNASDIGMSQVVRELLDEVERLTPRWQEGEPPEGPVWREGVPYPVRVKRSERYGLMYWDDGFKPWAADYGDAERRWAPIPKPTEG